MTTQPKARLIMVPSQSWDQQKVPSHRRKPATGPQSITASRAQIKSPGRGFGRLEIGGRWSRTSDQWIKRRRLRRSSKIERQRARRLTARGSFPNHLRRYSVMRFGSNVVASCSYYNCSFSGRRRRHCRRGRELVAKHDRLAADVRADALSLRRLDKVVPADHSEVRERAVDHDRVPQLLVGERRRASQVGNYVDAARRVSVATAAVIGVQQLARTDHVVREHFV